MSLNKFVNTCTPNQFFCHCLVQQQNNNTTHPSRVAIYYFCVCGCSGFPGKRAAHDIKPFKLLWSPVVLAKSRSWIQVFLLNKILITNHDRTTVVIILPTQIMHSFSGKSLKITIRLLSYFVWSLQNGYFNDPWTTSSCLLNDIVLCFGDKAWHEMEIDTDRQNTESCGAFFDITNATPKKDGPFN